MALTNRKNTLPRHLYFGHSPEEYVVSWSLLEWVAPSFLPCRTLFVRFSAPSQKSVTTTMGAVKCFRQVSGVETSSERHNFRTMLV